MPFVATLDTTIDYHTRWSKSERERQIWYNIQVQSKIWHKQTYLPNRNRLIDRVYTSGCQGGRGQKERNGLRIWGWYMQTIAFRMDEEQGPPV